MLDEQKLEMSVRTTADDNGQGVGVMSNDRMI